MFFVELLVMLRLLHPAKQIGGTTTEPK